MKPYYEHPSGINTKTPHFSHNLKKGWELFTTQNNQLVHLLDTGHSYGTKS